MDVAAQLITMKRPMRSDQRGNNGFMDGSPETHGIFSAFTMETLDLSIPDISRLLCTAAL
ncbi:MAG TPA: hypothetical protein DDY13_15670 [Cytophagales bacterium]|nr:hypothetical protein [Cytophagales bacterium]